MSKVYLALAAAAALSLPVAAEAAGTIVNIDATTTGCFDYSRCGGEHLGPGSYIGPLEASSPITLGPGTYTVTNAAGMGGALYDAWRFNGNDSNWIWAFMATDHATQTVVINSLYQADPATFVGDHTSVANSTYAHNYSGTFTLAQTTTLDFFTEDYAPGDNAGGASILITPVPEPGEWAALTAGLGVVGLAARRRKRAA